MIKKLALFSLALLPAVTQAASPGGEHAADGIPASVTYQAINFLLFAGLLFFLLKGKVRAFFNGREKEFQQALVKAEGARREAEQKRREIQERLTRLQSNSNESVAQARAEAAALKQKLMNEAQALTETLRQEAQRTARLEIERARNELREDLLNQSIALSRKMLEEKMAEPDQKRLQTEFVEKIQVVR